MCEGLMYLIFDGDKRFEYCGDAFPKNHQLKKGSHVMHVQVLNMCCRSVFCSSRCRLSQLRHSSLQVLESFKDMLVYLDRPLEKVKRL